MKVISKDIDDQDQSQKAQMLFFEDNCNLLLVCIFNNLKEILISLKDLFTWILGNFSGCNYILV